MNLNSTYTRSNFIFLVIMSSNETFNLMSSSNNFPIMKEEKTTPNTIIWYSDVLFDDPDYDSDLDWIPGINDPADD